MMTSRYIRNRALRPLARTTRRLLTLLALGGVAAAPLMLPGCAADDFDAIKSHDAPYGSDTQLVLTLAIPQGEELPAAATRADAANDAPALSDPSQAPKENELKINSLRLYIFPWGNTKAAAKINAPLLIPSEMPVNPDKSVTYEISGLEKGVEYRFYILANFGDDALSFASSEKLDEKIIDYTSDAHNLRPGNLPMVYKSKTPIKIEQDATTPVKQTLSLQYACAKIRYNIIFDKSDEAAANHKIDGKSAKDNFGDDKLTPESVTLTNVTKGAKIIWDNTLQSSFYTDESNTVATSTLTGYGFWPDYEYTETPTTGDRSNVADEYKVKGDAFADAATAGASDKWILQGTTYVPERYVDNIENQLGIVFKSKYNGATECEHKATIGIGDQKSIERGYYYEFTGHIVNTGLKGFKVTCDVRAWEPMTIDADFVSTFLTLSSTETYVDSEENGIIEYSTDGRGEVGFECGEEARVKIGDKTYDLFEMVRHNDEGSAQRTLEIRVNSNVDITDVPDSKISSRTGVPCYITVGNIKKQILVTYDIEPFFTVTPTSLKIQNGDGIQDENRYFEYRTNMGGIVITPKSGVSGNEIECSAGTTTSGETRYKMVDGAYSGLTFSDGSAPSSGKITVSYTFAGTTLVYEFTAKSKKSDSNNKYKTVDLKIEVMPAKTKYRVYFRAINDYQAGNGDEFLHENGYVLPAEYSGTGSSNNNWIDYWNYNNRKSTSADGDRHRIYAYTQYGQDANTQPNWRYTSNYGYSDEFEYKNTGDIPGWKSKPYMIADSNNPGWYYYDMPVKCDGNYDTENKTTETAKGTDLYNKYGYGPLPGATLLIFYSDESANAAGGDAYTGGSRHRVNQANAPGIPLGDDNDNETWVLYDPSRDPVYVVYNDKPVIEDVTYTIYSDKNITGWRHDYGLCNIHGTVGNSIKKVTSDKAGYNKYELPLKAVKGEYDKAVMLRTGDGLAKESSGKLRFFFGVPLNYTSAWPAPELAVKGGDSEYYRVAMTKDIVINNIQYYYVDLIQDYHVNDAKNNGIAIYSNGAGTNRTPQTGHKQLNGSKAEEIVAYYNDWNVVDAGKAAGVENNNATFILMFGGRNWTTGYFKNGSWSRNP